MSRHRSARSTFRFYLSLVCLLVPQGCGEKPGLILTTSVKSGPFTKYLEVTGSLVSDPKVRINSPEDGVLQWLEEEGSRVKAGAIVARVFAQSLEDQIREKELILEMIRYERLIEEANLEGQDFELQNRLRFAELDLETLKITREILQRGVDPVEITRVEVQLENTRREIQRLEEGIAEQRPFVEKGLIPRLDQQDMMTQLEQARFNLESETLERQFLLRGGDPKDLATIHRDIRVSTSNLELAQLKIEGFKSLREETLAEIDARFETEQAELDELRARQTDTAVRAPIAGLLLYASRSLGPMGDRDEVMMPGANVTFGDQILTIIGDGAPYIEVRALSADAVDLEEGQDVTFRLGAIPGQEFTGKVTQVKAVATGRALRRWVYPDSRKVVARIDCLQTDPRFRAGMTANLDIVRQHKDQTLYVEAGAVDAEKVTLKDGTIRQVTTGFWADAHVEILDGLSAGDRIRLPEEPAPLDDLTEVRITRGTLIRKLEVQGEVKSRNVMPVSLKELEGRAKIVQIVDDGTHVEAGEEVALAASPELTTQLKEKSLDVQIKEKSLAMTEEQGRKDIFALTNELTIEQLELEISELKRSLLLMGRPEREREDLKIDLDKVKEDLNSVERLLSIKIEFSKRGFASDKEVDDLKKQLGLTRLGFDVASVKTELASMTGTPRERRRALVDVLKRQLGRELKQKKLESEFTDTELKLKKSHVELEMARIEVGRFERMIAGLSVKAPHEGVCMIIETWRGAGPAKYAKGDDISQGDVFMQVAATDSLEVVAPVSEERIHEVSVGTSAKVRLIGEDSSEHPASIRAIGLVAKPRAGRVERLLGGSSDKAFDVLLDLTETSPMFQPGSSVRVTIELERLEDVVLVPRNAVFQVDGETVVRIADGVEGGTTRPVTLGATDEENYQVLEGIEPGATILRRSDDG